MTVSGCFFLLGAGLQAGANNLTQLIVGRSILGFGVGAPLLLLLHASINPLLLLWLTSNNPLLLLCQQTSMLTVHSASAPGCLALARTERPPSETAEFGTPYDTLALQVLPPVSCPCTLLRWRPLPAEEASPTSSKWPQQSASWLHRCRCCWLVHCLCCSYSCSCCCCGSVTATAAATANVGHCPGRMHRVRADVHAIATVQCCSHPAASCRPPAPQLVNYGTQYIPDWGWRLSLGLAAMPASILCLGGLVLPESPSYLIEK